MAKAKRQVIAVVRSRSNRRKTYSITRQHGGYVCPCLSFRFAPGEIGSRTKRCRHLKEAGL